MTTQHPTRQTRPAIRRDEVELPAAPPARRSPKRESAQNASDQQPIRKETPVAAFIAGGTIATAVIAIVLFFALRSPPLETVKGNVESKAAAPDQKSHTTAIAENSPRPAEPVPKALVVNDSQPRKMSPVEVHPVSGGVKYNGGPASGAFVVFHPLGEPLPRNARPSGQVRKDGSFTLSTFSAQDGAPAGKYAVTVQWRKLVESSTGEEMSKNVIPKRYLRPETSGLHVEVVAGENNVPTFELKD